LVQLKVNFQITNNADFIRLIQIKTEFFKLFCRRVAIVLKVPYVDDAN